MILNPNRDKYLKTHESIQTISLSETNQHPAVGVDEQNAIQSIRWWLTQLSSLVKQNKCKFIPTDVETRTANDYIYHLIKKNLNNSRNFSQIYDCVISYLNHLSRLKLQYFDCGSFIKSTQGCHQQLRIFQLSNGKGYKNNSVGTEEIFLNFSTPIVENLLTGNRFSRNECYKVATWFYPVNSVNCRLL
ncbi:hypothetical protein NIES37_07270 [Tolypothrix tenuis PCC 7101]|uniref:Uncharacterized protein n=1 Tax=Tolypothrix tenuis PCC 7101 TaxID=231146 RepID=A0A1Z4MTI5_9CYAN|nr:hypothetical protein [Aulosira sp. FACHB-113]BAY96790.1 hypothetical protein NIES37_07270 [Tolypothrix tenuis PCC 7101]BAZ72702.1 hypothetical protein NIES50_12560 [Aulosira laxa NIES-50]